MFLVFDPWVYESLITVISVKRSIQNCAFLQRKALREQGVIQSQCLQSEKGSRCSTVPDLKPLFLLANFLDKQLHSTFLDTGEIFLPNGKNCECLGKQLPTVPPWSICGHVACWKRRKLQAGVVLRCNKMQLHWQCHVMSVQNKSTCNANICLNMGILVQRPFVIWVPP